MAKIVELSGSPGVGKTTIYREIKAKWKKKDNWIPAGQLLPHPGLSVDYVRMFLSYLPKRLKGKAGGTFYDMKMGVRGRFAEQYPEYMDACWSDLIVMHKKTLNGSDLRLRKAEQLGGQIETFQFLKESETDKVAILEEGLIHLLDVISFRDTHEEIIEIIDLMPLPDALIYIETDVQENVRRLLKRGEFISYHTSLSTDQLLNVTQQSHDRRMKINKVLEDRGVLLLHIDAKASVEANTSKIISFIETLHASNSPASKKMV